MSHSFTYILVIADKKKHPRFQRVLAIEPSPFLYLNPNIVHLIF